MNRRYEEAKKWVKELADANIPITSESLAKAHHVIRHGGQSLLRRMEIEGFIVMEKRVYRQPAVYKLKEKATIVPRD